MSYKQRRPKNPDEPARIYTNRQVGCVCVGCNQLIPIGVQKTWTRITGRKANYHMPCAERLGVLVQRDGKWYRPDGQQPPVMDEVFHPVHPTPAPQPVPVEVEPEPEEDDVDIDTPEVTPDEPEAPKPPQPKPEMPPWMQGFADAILPYVEDKINAKADKDEIKALIEKYGVKREVLEVHNKRNGHVQVIEGRQHPEFKRLLDLCQMGMHTMLVGPCASGKTTSVRHAAKALGYKIFLQGPVATKYDLLGYNDGPGNYHPTPFQQWFTSKEPAMLLWDEYDGNEANALLDTNPALENRICNFPYSGEPVELGNENSVACACANTWGLGGTDDFVGRCRQDAAALNRWVQLPWEYDTEMERAIAGNDAWVARVQRLRANAKAKGLRVVISPRASIRGAKMLAGGWPQAEVERIEIRKSMTETEWRSIQ